LIVFIDIGGILDYQYLSFLIIVRLFSVQLCPVVLVDVQCTVY